MVEGTRGIELCVTRYRKYIGETDAMMAWPTSEAEMLAAQMDDPELADLITRLSIPNGKPVFHNH